MSFPPQPIAADKTNASDRDVDHPAHHNLLAAGVNDLVAQVETVSSDRSLWAIGLDSGFGAAWTAVVENYLSAAAREAIDDYAFDQPAGSFIHYDADGNEAMWMTTGIGGDFSAGDVRPMRVRCDHNGIPDFTDYQIGTLTGVPAQIHPGQDTFWASLKDVRIVADEDLGYAIVHAEDQVDGVSLPGAHWLGYLAICPNISTSYDWEVVSTTPIIDFQSTNPDLTGIPDGGAQTFFQSCPTPDGTKLEFLMRDVASDDTTICKLGLARMDIAEAEACAINFRDNGVPGSLPTVEKMTAPDVWGPASSSFCHEIVPAGSEGWLGGFDIFWMPEAGGHLLVYGKETSSSSGVWSLYGMFSTDGMRSFGERFVIRSMSADPTDPIEPVAYQMGYLGGGTDNEMWPIGGAIPLTVVMQPAAGGGWGVEDIPVALGWLRPTSAPVLQQIPQGKNDEEIYFVMGFDTDIGRGGDTFPVAGYGSLPDDAKVIYVSGDDDVKMYDALDGDNVDLSSEVDLLDPNNLFRSFRTEFYITSEALWPAARFTTEARTGVPAFTVEGEHTLGPTLPVLPIKDTGYAPAVDGSFQAIFNTTGQVNLVEGDVVVATVNGVTFDDDYHAFQVNGAAEPWTDLALDPKTIFLNGRSHEIGQIAADSTITHPVADSMQLQIVTVMGGTPVGAPKGRLIGTNGANEFQQLDVGADETVLTADAAEPLGWKWDAPAPPAPDDSKFGGWEFISAAGRASDFGTALFDHDPTTFSRTGGGASPTWAPGSLIMWRNWGPAVTLVGLALEIVACTTGDIAVVSAHQLDGEGFPTDETASEAFTLDAGSLSVAANTKTGLTFEVPEGGRMFSVLFPSGNNVAGVRLASAVHRAGFRHGAVATNTNGGLDDARFLWEAGHVGSTVGDVGAWPISRTAAVGSLQVPDHGTFDRLPMIWGQRA